MNYTEVIYIISIKTYIQPNNPLNVLHFTAIIINSSLVKTKESIEARGSQHKRQTVQMQCMAVTKETNKVVQERRSCHLHTKGTLLYGVEKYNKLLKPLLLTVPRTFTYSTFFI